MMMFRRRFAFCCWFDVSAGLASQARAVGLEHLEQPARPEMHQCRSASCRAAKHKATWFGWGWGGVGERCRLTRLRLRLMV